MTTLASSTSVRCSARPSHHVCQIHRTIPVRCIRQSHQKLNPHGLNLRQYQVSGRQRRVCKAGQVSCTHCPDTSVKATATSRTQRSGKKTAKKVSWTRTHCSAQARTHTNTKSTRTTGTTQMLRSGTLILWRHRVSTTLMCTAFTSLNGMMKLATHNHLSRSIWTKMMTP